MECVSQMRFKSPKNSRARASFERASVVIITVSTRNEQACPDEGGICEFPYRAGSGILNRNRMALHNLGLIQKHYGLA